MIEDWKEEKEGWSSSWKGSVSSDWFRDGSIYSKPITALTLNNALK